MGISKATAGAVAPGAKGDLVVGSGTNDAAVLAVGTNGHTLVADSAETTGLKWVFGGTFKGVMANLSSNVTVANDTFTTIGWDAADIYDTDGYHDPVTNNTRITIPSGLGGYYLVWGFNNWTQGATGYRYAVIRKNGTTQVLNIIQSAGNGQTFAQETLQPIGVLNLVAGDYIEYRVYQNNGGNLVINSGDQRNFFGVALIGV